MSLPRKRLRETVADANQDGPNASLHFPETPRRKGDNSDSLPISKAKKDTAAASPLHSPYFPANVPIVSLLLSPSSPRHPATSSSPLDPLAIHGLPRTPHFFGLIQELLSPVPFRLLIAVSLLNLTRGTVAFPVLWTLLLRWPTPTALASADEEELTDILQPTGMHRIRARRLRSFAQQWLSDPPDPRKVTRIRGPLGKGQPPSCIAHLPGIGRYAVDSYRIFCGPGSAQRTLGRPPVLPILVSIEDAARGWSAEEDALVDAPAEKSLVGINEHAKEENEEDIAEWKSVMPLDKELQAYLMWRWAKEGTVWTPERGVVGQLQCREEIEAEA